MQEPADLKNKSVKKDMLAANLMNIKSMVQGVSNTQEVKEESSNIEFSVIPAARCIRSSHDSIERAKELCRPSELYLKI